MKMNLLALDYYLLMQKRVNIVVISDNTSGKNLGFSEPIAVVSDGNNTFVLDRDFNSVFDVILDSEGPTFGSLEVLSGGQDNVVGLGDNFLRMEDLALDVDRVWFWILYKQPLLK